jgi:hypothetical protein
LDNTLRGIIERFEAEFPETRVEERKPEPVGAVEATYGLSGSAISGEAATKLVAGSRRVDSSGDKDSESELEDDDMDDSRVLTQAHRKPSDVSLAAKALGKEEGTVHKLGQQAKRRILSFEQSGTADSTGDGHDSEHEAPKPGHDEDSAIVLDDEAIRDNSNLQAKIEDEHIRVLREKLAILSATSSNVSDEDSVSRTQSVQSDGVQSNSTVGGVGDHKEAKKGV